MSDDQLSIEVLVGPELELAQGIPNIDLPVYSAETRHLDTSVMPFSLDRNHPAMHWLMRWDSRVRVMHRGRELFTGMAKEKEFAFGDTADKLRNFIVYSDERLLENVPALVVPENRIVPQSLDDMGQTRATGTVQPGTATNRSGYFLWQGASAESAVKNIIGRNLTAWGIPHRILEDQGRGGAPVAPSVRFSTLAEAVRPVLELAGLGIRVWREEGSAEYLVDVYETQQHGPWLTTAGAVQPGGRIRMVAPTVTDLLMGGPGEEAARALRTASMPAWAADFGGERVILFRDSTGAPVEWPDQVAENFRVPAYLHVRPEVSAQAKAEFEAYFAQDARRAFDGGGPLVSLNAELAETATFAFGASFDLGDRVRIAEAVDESNNPVGVQVEDRISSVTIARESAGDETVTPRIGGAEGSEDEQLWAALAVVSARSDELRRSR